MLVTFVDKLSIVFAFEYVAFAPSQAVHVMITLTFSIIDKVKLVDFMRGANALFGREEIDPDQAKFFAVSLAYVTRALPPHPAPMGRYTN